MPDIYPPSGFNLGALPQYNPAPAADFVRTPIQSLASGAQQGMNLGANIAALGPELSNRITQARLQTAAAQAQIPLQQSLADAQAAQAKATKAQADYQTQNLQNRAQLLQTVHGLVGGAILGGATAGAPSAIAAQNDTANSPQGQGSPFDAAQAIPDQPAQAATGTVGALGQGGAFSPASIPAIQGVAQVGNLLHMPALQGLGSVAAYSQAAPQPPPTAPQAKAQPVPQLPPVGSDVWSRPAQPQLGPQNATPISPATAPQAVDTVNKLWDLLPDEQRLDLAQNILSYRSNPLAQSQVAKVYSDIQESLAHSNYFNAFAQWRAAEGANLLQTGGRYGLNNQIAQSFQKAGIVIPNVIDQDAYNLARQTAQDSGLDPSEVNQLDYVDQNKLQTEIKRVAGEKKDLKATSPSAFSLPGYDSAGNPLPQGEPASTPSAGNTPAQGSTPTSTVNPSLSSFAQSLLPK